MDQKGVTVAARDVGAGIGRGNLPRRLRFVATAAMALHRRFLVSRVTGRVAGGGIVTSAFNCCHLQRFAPEAKGLPERGGVGSPLAGFAWLGLMKGVRDGERKKSIGERKNERQRFNS